MLAPTAAHAMLSLNEVLCCESSVMKAWLNCLESARTSAAAATGAIARIFDVSMVGRRRRRRREADRTSEPQSRGVEDEERGVPCLSKLGSFCAHRAAGGAPITTVPSDFFGHVAFLRTGTRYIIYISAPRLSHVGTLIGSMSHDPIMRPH